MTKNVLTIIPKPHAHPHTMKKTYAKFQNDRYRTVRGVALTRGTHCLYTEGKKWLSSQCGKSDKKCSNNYTQTTCTSSYHEENTRKVSNNQYKTVRGFVLTRGTHCLYIEVKKWLSSQCGKSVKKIIKQFHPNHMHILMHILKENKVSNCIFREKEKYFKMSARIFTQHTKH